MQKSKIKSSILALELLEMIPGQSHFFGLEALLFHTIEPIISVNILVNIHMNGTVKTTLNRIKEELNDL